MEFFRNGFALWIFALSSIVSCIQANECQVNLESVEQIVCSARTECRNNTFDVFEKVQDRDGIAIDIGSQIGTTAVLLSNYFHHVVAVDEDGEAIQRLRSILKEQQCHNVSAWDIRVGQERQLVECGPRDPNASSGKFRLEGPLDYHAKSMTFKQLVHDTIYANEELTLQKVSFIKCDIGGEEEAVLEDMLHFAFYSHCPIYISFCIERWHSKTISDFEYLFKFFDVFSASANPTSFDQIEDIVEYFAANPSASLLLEPRQGVGDLIKKNVTVVIIGYNQYTYIKHMVDQLEKYTKDICIIDNNSSYGPLLDYYQNEFKYTLLRQAKNHGYRVYMKDWVEALTGGIYILTDPDLQLNPNLPDDFIQEMIEVSNYYQVSKVGFALLIAANDIREDVLYRGFTIQQWERQFWEKRMRYGLNPRLELYWAAIDTTFCLVNRRYSEGFIRIAGDYTCVHIPWHNDFQRHFSEDEFDCYMKNNLSTTWFKANR